MRWHPIIPRRYASLEQNSTTGGLLPDLTFTFEVRRGAVPRSGPEKKGRSQWSQLPLADLKPGDVVDVTLPPGASETAEGSLRTYVSRYGTKSDRVFAVTKVGDDGLRVSRIEPSPSKLDSTKEGG